MAGMVDNGTIVLALPLIAIAAAGFYSAVRLIQMGRERRR